MFTFSFMETGLSDQSNLFLASALTLSKDKFIQSQFFVAPCMVVLSQEKKLARFPLEKVLEILRQAILR